VVPRFKVAPRAVPAAKRRNLRDTSDVRQKVQRNTLFMNSLVWIAVVLVVAWIVLRFLLAITSGLIHLLWIIAIICFFVWLYRKITSGRNVRR
jgi:hypothetical protein